MYWENLWGRILSVQPVNAPDMQPNLGILLVDIGNLVWFLSSIYQPRPESFLGPFEEISWTHARWSKSSYLFLASIYVIVSGSWPDPARKKLQTEFSLVHWLRKWQCDLHITGKSCNIPYETYYSKLLGSWPWVCPKIHSLKRSGGTSDWLYSNLIGYID